MTTPATIGRRGLLISAGLLVGAGAARARDAREQSTGRFGRALSRIDELLAAEHARTGAASIVAGVIAGPELIWSKAYGLADTESRKVASTSGVYRIGSITKQFTAVAFLQLVKRGKVRLTDPVEKHLPEINLVQERPAGSPPITLLQLATHTSGLDREPGDVATYTTGPVGTWEKSLLAALPHTRYAFEPGTRQSYSNIAVGSLGLALSRAAGEPYTDYVRKNILDPLGLRDTSFQPEGDLLGRVATGYEVRGGGAPDPTLPRRELQTGRGYKVPNGALFTTVADLSHFVSFELGHGPPEVLDPSRLAENFSRVYGSDGKLGVAFGLGFQLQRKGDLVIAGHGGSVAGFVAGAHFHAPSQTGIVYLRNLGQGIRSEVLFEAFTALTGS